MGNPKGRLELTWMGKDMALIPSTEGSYDYQWVSPRDPRATEVKLIETVRTVGEDPSSNLLITGDSGDALRALGTNPEWADRYLGKVKLVYIDPPFNTEQSFEHYADQLEHSVWLTMMRDRLRHIIPLLSDDGSVWVHLDDAEVHRMRSLMDELLGAGNFIAEVIWEKADSPNNSAQFLSTDHDTILVYAKDKRVWRPNKLPRTAAVDAIYKNSDNDPRGRWYAGDPFANKPYSLGLYKVEGPTGRFFAPPPGRYWRISESKFRALDDDGRIWWGPAGDARPSIKRFLDDVSGMVPRTLWKHAEVGSNRSSKNEMRALFPGVSSFSTPKPERLLERVLHIGSKPGDLVLDCFAGSGTTAAAAHKMNRRWVSVELQESTVTDFIIPRLTKVVEGRDPGGITSAKTRLPASELAEGISADEAQAFTSVIGKLSKTIPGLDETTMKALRAATRTKETTTLRWEGGGGFTVARMGPSMYEVDDEDGTIYLSEMAVNGTFAQAVCGQLGFRRDITEPVFCGRKGRMRLAVIDGMADEQVVRAVASSLGEDEKAVVVAKGIQEGAAALLRELSPGSKIRKAPDDIFMKGTVK